MLSTLVLKLSSKYFLDCENSDNENLKFGEYNEEVFYEEPDLSGGVEGIDYDIVYGTEDVKAEAEV